MILVHLSLAGMVTGSWQSTYLRVYRPLFSARAVGRREELLEATVHRNDQRAPDGRSPTC